MAEIETERLLLRHWREEDAPELFRYAADPRVGPSAGWTTHTSVEESRQIIRTVLSTPECYAIVLLSTGLPIGSVELMLGRDSNLSLGDGEGEIGYWLGAPYWGRGLMPEAVRALLQRAFCDLGLKRVWCGYFDGNAKSRRVQEKCGFRYHHTLCNLLWARTGEIKTEHVTRLDREDWPAQTQDGAEK